MTATSLDLVRELRTICGEEHVLEPEHLPHPPSFSHAIPQEAGAQSTSYHAAAMVSPGTEQEVAAVVRLANQHRLTIAAVGLPSRARWPASAHIVLSTSRLQKIEHYDAGDLTVGVGAGTTAGEVRALLAPDGLMFAADPPCPDLATIGGVLAAASHGPLRHGYGSVRDFCIGVRFVTGDGRIGKGGGRVVKNVAGYDIMKLLIGSFGTLAVITSASFKLFPTPRQTRTFLAEFAAWQEALAFRDAVMKSPLSPMCLELVSPGARRKMRPTVTGDAWVICVRAAGSDAVLARYRRELGSAVTREIDGEEEARLWRTLADFPTRHEEAQRCASPLRLRADYPFSIFAPPAELASVLQIFEQNSNPRLVTLDYIGRVGVGHLLVAYDMVETEVVEPDFISALREQMPKSVQFVGSPSAPVSASMRAVKQALDPNNVLRGGL